MPSRIAGMSQAIFLIFVNTFRPLMWKLRANH